MLIEKEWENFSKPLYLVSARAEWYEEKSKRSLSRENRWLHNSARETRKVMC